LAEAPATLLARRFAALLYDAALVAALLLLASWPAVLFHHGEAFSPGHPGFRAYLLAVSFFYFGWSWTHGGQTLGMKAWRLRCGASAGTAVTWPRALARFCLALLFLVPLAGLGLLSMLAERERQGWHDKLSGTRVVLEG